MRTILSIALLLIAFVIGQADAAQMPDRDGGKRTQVGAAELTAAQAQLIMSVAATAPKDGTTTVDVTLTIGTAQVVFKVTRDAVGNVIARPVPGSDSGGIAQISFGTETAPDGSLVPRVMVQVNTDLTVKSQSVSVANGVITAFGTDATLAGTSTSGGAAPVIAYFTVASSFTFLFKLTLPAGANPGQSASPARPGG